MSHPLPEYEALTVTLNPAIDRTVSIPHFRAGAVNRVEHVQQNPGGKGVNVAVTLASAGHHVAVTGFLGRENSASFETMFANMGIADFFVRIAGQTRVGIKIVDPTSQETTDLNFPGPQVTPTDQGALLDQLAEIRAPWVVLAGSLPSGTDPAIYSLLIGALQARGCRVVVDTSGESLRHALKAKPQVVKPNIHELEALLDRSLAEPAAVLEAARQLLSYGVELAVISMGEQGAFFVSPEEALLARPLKVAVQSTVGAGDAMVAGLVAGQLRGLSLEETARLATAFSADSISRVGSGLSDAATIAELAQRVAVETVAE